MAENIAMTEDQAEGTIEGMRAVYESSADQCNPPLTEAEVATSRKLIDGAIEILRNNPDLTDAINNAHPEEH